MLCLSGFELCSRWVLFRSLEKIGDCEQSKYPRILQCGEHARSNIVGDTSYALSCLNKHSTDDTQAVKLR